MDGSFHFILFHGIFFRIEIRCPGMSLDPALFGCVACPGRIAIPAVELAVRKPHEYLAHSDIKAFALYRIKNLVYV